MDNGDLKAIIQFHSDGRPKRIFLDVRTDQEEKILKQALSRLIKPSFLTRVFELFS